MHEVSEVFIMKGYILFIIEQGTRFTICIQSSKKHRRMSRHCEKEESWLKAINSTLRAGIVFAVRLA